MARSADTHHTTPQRSRGRIVAGLVLVVVVVLFIKGQFATQSGGQATVTDSSPAAQLEQSRANRQSALIFFHSNTCESCVYMSDMITAIWPEYVDVNVYDQGNATLIQAERVRVIPTSDGLYHERTVKIGLMEPDMLRQQLLALTFVALGVAASLIGSIVGGWRGWYYLLVGLCFLIGLHLLGAFILPVPSWFSDLSARIQLRGLPGTLALGLVFGLVASQWATLVLAAILTTVMARQNGLAYGALLLFVYALGRGTPVVAAGTFASALRRLSALGSWSNRIEQASGIVIIGVGLYLLWIV